MALDRAPVLIGPFTFDPDCATLTDKDRKVLRLRPQSAEILRLLADQRGQLVTRAEMIETVWADICVTDDSLTQCISEIRRALGSGHRGLLRTIHRKGYLLEFCRSGSPGRSTDQISDDKPSFEAQLRPTIAVLPLELRTTGDDLDTLGSLLVDDLTLALSRSDVLNVISRLSAGQFDPTTQTLNAVGADLGANHIVTGSVFRHGEDTVLTLELCPVSTGRVLWSDRIVRRTTDLISNLETMHHLAAAIQNAILSAELRRVRKNRLPDLPCYSMLLGAIELMHRASPTQYADAYRLLCDLQDRVPGDGCVSSWLGYWHYSRLIRGWSDDQDRDALLALRLSEEVLEQDPSCVLALTTYGQIVTSIHRDPDEAIVCYSTALDVNPNAPYARLLRGTLEAFRGNTSAGEEDVERALKLTPHHPHRFYHLFIAAGARLAAGAYDAALSLTQESLSLNRAFTPALRCRMVVEHLLGRDGDARQTFDDLMARAPAMTVSAWKRASPAGMFEIGDRVANSMRAIGVPE